MLGDSQEAVALLEEAFSNGVRVGVWLTDDPDLEPLRGDAAFDQLTRPKG